MVRVKFTKGALVKGVQYGVGDIYGISEREALNLYGLRNAEPHFGNLNQEGFGLPKENQNANQFPTEEDLI